MLEKNTVQGQVATAGAEDRDGLAGLGLRDGGRDLSMSQALDPEMVAQAKRRTFTAQYKARILAEADRCTRPGEVGELLRRERLYTSHLTFVA